VEEAELLHANILARRSSGIIALVLSWQLSGVFCLAYADDFSEGVLAGQTQASGLMNRFTPSQLDATLQSSGIDKAALVPGQADAETQKGNYTTYYGNPAGMAGEGAADGSAGAHVLNSYQHRPVTDLHNDPIFGKVCLERDVDGKCTLWSGSKGILTSTYPDCQEITTVTNTDPADVKTCVRDQSLVDTSCVQKAMIQTVSEIVPGRCADTQLDVQPGQLYAGCRDEYRYVKVLIGSQEAVGPNISGTGSMCRNWSRPDIRNIDGSGPEFVDQLLCPRYDASSLTPPIPGEIGMEAFPNFRIDMIGNMDMGYGFAYTSTPGILRPEVPRALPGSALPVEAVPAGAAYVGRSYENPVAIFHPGDYAYFTWVWDQYAWYALFDHARIERVSLVADAVCGGGKEYMETNCTVKDLVYCNDDGSDCLPVVSSGAPAQGVFGQSFISNYYTAVKTDWAKGSCADCDTIDLIVNGGYYETGYSANPLYDVSMLAHTAANCQPVQCSGLCPRFPAQTNAPGEVLVGRQVETVPDVSVEAYRYGSCDITPYSCKPETGICFPPPLLHSHSSRATDYYINATGLQCVKAAGVLDNYTICFKDGAVGLANSDAAHTISENVIHYDYSQTDNYGLTVTGAYTFGGQKIDFTLASPHTKVTWSCGQTDNPCQQYNDQGCYQTAAKCVNDTCSQIEETWNCGGSGAGQSATKTVTCLGEVKCMGTECAAAQDGSSTTFSDSVAGTSILNQTRADAVSDGNATTFFASKQSQCSKKMGHDCCTEITASPGQLVAAYNLALDAYAIELASSQGFMANGALLIDKTIESAQSVMSWFSTGDPGQAQAAADAGFQTAGNGGLESGTVDPVSGEMTPGTSAMQVIGPVLTAYAMYKFGKTMYEIMTACGKDELATSYRQSAGLCHFIGKECTSRGPTGGCLERQSTYCCFNSLFGRVFQEQARAQLSIPWVDAAGIAVCRALTMDEIQRLDGSKIDLSEYMNYVLGDKDFTQAKKDELMGKLPGQVQSVLQAIQQQ